MKNTTILDVLRAVTRVAMTHHEVESWWYAPSQRFSLEGEPAREANEPEIGVLAIPGAEIDEGLIGRELGTELGLSTVHVRRVVGPGERNLFRLYSSDGGHS